ncbi:MAG: S49 family peptidase [Anaerolineae bacterium]|nr:S49 family peptidase [Anaerolineae bacterium]
MMSEMSGAVSVQKFTAQFRAALRDPDIASIVIDVDSPGGQVGGVEELAAEIFDARGQKPITAVVNTLAASAAYWIASAADEIVISPSGQAGSIGVFLIHEDMSAALAAAGETVTLISAGKYKVEGNPFEPLTEEARGAMQEMVNEYYGMFTKAVARNRGVKVADVRNGFGEGRVVGAGQAVALGMADLRGHFLMRWTQRRQGRARNGRGAAADLEFRSNGG